MNEKEIKKLNEELDKLLEDEYNETQPIIEMVDISKQKTNLPVIVWVDGPRNVPHAKRIKFANDYGNRLKGVELIPVTLKDPHVPENLKNKVNITEKDLQLVYEWVKLNSELIEKYMNGEIDTETFLSLVQKGN